jgi:uncharacterized protein YjbI with pentapeptide repeats
MANPEHLKILQKGVEVWNRWRKEHPEIRPDLSQASLQRAYLSGIDLSKVDLLRVDLGWAHLGGANLHEANLREATLIETTLSMADLTQAVLSKADLSSTNFSSAVLTGADLTEAHLAYTVFGNTTLSNIKGLDTCYHYGPSIIDFQTLGKSGPLPLSFLRGCGLPDSLIDYLPSLLNKESTQFYSCFISYSNRDEDFARRIYTDLQTAGVRSWFAPADLSIGDQVGIRIAESIQVYDKLLLILSEHATTSAWVEKEVAMALKREREQHRTVLFPIRLDDTVMESRTGWAADILQSRYIGDFTQWKDHVSYQRALSRLLRDLTLTIASESDEKERV